MIIFLNRAIKTDFSTKRRAECVCSPGSARFDLREAYTLTSLISTT